MFKFSSALRPVRYRAHRSNILAPRCFTTDGDSHDDFKPKKKPQARDALPINDVTDIIKKQISENPVMLYMKVS